VDGEESDDSEDGDALAALAEPSRGLLWLLLLLMMMMLLLLLLLLLWR
jgi:hypothetical protein